MEWTGLEAIALKTATRRSIREFAADLGVGHNTVTKWSQRGAAITLRPLNQRVLDEAFARADDAAKARFAEILRQARAGQTVPSPPRRLDGSDMFGIDATSPSLARRGGRPMPQLAVTREVDSSELTGLEALAGHVVDLDLRIDLQISDDGAARVLYCYETVNLTDRPLTRMSRELWFEYTAGGLRIEPLTSSSRQVAIQRIHDTPNLAKFACQISPSIKPGEAARIGYCCVGGRFVDALYWRQSIYRHTRRLSIHLRHAGAGRMLSCSATEEHPDGAENSAAEGLIWDHDGRDVVATLTRDHLRPNQSVTLHWEVTREHP
ncbi:hypothetical protein [Nocardia lijiangensis]|uniref:hypothetical protein n=1 Tax=Nocardia lijiangensis TaxID=299618 RepID=UPI00082CEF8D|nr:hypothetical protein [Nocardia lijiangensis]